MEILGIGFALALPDHLGTALLLFYLSLGSGGINCAGGEAKAVSFKRWLITHQESWRELLKTEMGAGCLFAAHKIRCLCLRLWNFLLVSLKEDKSHSWFHNSAAVGITLNVTRMPQTMRIKIWKQCLPGPRDQGYLLTDADQQLHWLWPGSSSPRGRGLMEDRAVEPLHVRPAHSRFTLLELF